MKTMIAIFGEMKDGWIRLSESGIRACLSDQSYFYSGRYPVMHFHEDDWHQYGCLYPEIAAIAYHTKVQEFCFPPDALYRMERSRRGNIIVKIYAKEMPRTPVLVWVFPNPSGKKAKKIYRSFFNSFITCADADSEDEHLGQQIMLIEDIDNALLSAKGNPYGYYPDAAMWLKLVFKGKTLSRFLSESNDNHTAALEEAHIIMASKVRDDTWKGFREENRLLIAACARRVAQKLSELTNKAWIPFEYKPRGSC